MAWKKTFAEFDVKAEGSERTFFEFPNCKLDYEKSNLIPEFADSHRVAFLLRSIWPKG